MPNDDLPPWEGPDLIDRKALTRDAKIDMVKKTVHKHNSMTVIDLTAFVEAGDDEDMGGLFKARKRYVQAKREQNLEKAYKERDERWTVHSEYHWSTTLCSEKLDYWPSSTKFRWKGKTYVGGVEGFIRKHERRGENHVNNK